MIKCSFSLLELSVIGLVFILLTEDDRAVYFSKAFTFLGVCTSDTVTRDSTLDHNEGFLSPKPLTSRTVEMGFKNLGFLQKK